MNISLDILVSNYKIEIFYRELEEGPRGPRFACQMTQNFIVVRQGRRSCERCHLEVVEILEVRDDSRERPDSNIQTSLRRKP